jgi:decaprenylphospho-beta-D-ribofuranose 2-oxidase
MTPLTGWGRIAPTWARVAQPTDADEVAALLAAAPARGVIARGLGRSYNNAAQNDGGLVISTTRLNRVLSFDPAAGEVSCEAGVGLEQSRASVRSSTRWTASATGTRSAAPAASGSISASCQSGQNAPCAGAWS